MTKFSFFQICQVLLSTRRRHHSDSSRMASYMTSRLTVPHRVDRHRYQVRSWAPCSPREVSRNLLMISVLHKGYCEGGAVHIIFFLPCTVQSVKTAPALSWQKAVEKTNVFHVHCWLFSPVMAKISRSCVTLLFYYDRDIPVLTNSHNTLPYWRSYRSPRHPLSFHIY
jgi:hypothetical protein